MAFGGSCIFELKMTSVTFEFSEKKNLSWEYCEYRQPQKELETMNKLIKEVNPCPKYGWF